MNRKGQKGQKKNKWKINRIKTKQWHAEMKKRSGDLWWVSPPAVVGPLVVGVTIVGALLVLFLARSGNYQGAILVTAGAIFFVCLAIADLLGEILGCLRDAQTQGTEPENETERGDGG